MSNVAGNTETESRSRKHRKEIPRDEDQAKKALDHTCWFLSWQLTGRRKERRFHYRILDGQAFIHDSNRVEVKGSRKPLEKWIEIGRQLRLAEAAVWLSVGKYPKPSEEPDPKKRVRFWFWFDGIRRVFVFQATLGSKHLTDKEIDKRYGLHRRLWLLASQGAAIEQLYLQVEKKLAYSEQQVLDMLAKVGEQLGFGQSSICEIAGAMHPQFSHRPSIAYSG